MPVVDADVKLRLTNPALTAGGGGAGTPATSLGEFASTTELSGTTLNNLFDDVSGDENAASDVEYRCIAVHNSHGSLALTGVKMWLTSEVSGGASIAIGVDPAGPFAYTHGSAQGTFVNTEQDNPVGVTFTAPTTKGAGISLGDLAAGEVRLVWFRRTAANTSALSADGVTFRAEGDTAA